jgi:hypothetical protein
MDKCTYVSVYDGGRLLLLRTAVSEPSEIVMPHVLLLGATGGMGRRVADLWASETPDIPLRLGVRRPEAFAGLGLRAVLARLDDPASLHSALSGVTAVINAVGPYAYDPRPLLDACEAAGVHYVDLASEPEFLAAVWAWASRRDVGIAVCPGASTIPGLVELSATHLAHCIGVTISSFDIYLSMGSANPLTPGLLASLTLQLGVPLRSSEGGIAFRKLRPRRLHGLGERLFGRYPAPFDEHGIQVHGRVVRARFWVGLDRTWIVHALRGVSFLRPHFSAAGWIALTEWARPLAGWVNRIGGTRGGMRIEALGAAGAVLGTANFLAPREGLNIPALPSIWAARALCGAARSGLCPLHTLVTFAQAAGSLESHGFEAFVTAPREAGYAPSAL